MALDTHRHKRARTARLACTIGLTGALVMSGATQALTLSPTPAYAASSETLAELNRLQGQLSSASSTYSEATSNAAELNAQVAEIADEILHIEQDLLPARQ